MFFLVNSCPEPLEVATFIRMLRVLGNILCDLGPKVKLKGKKSGYL